MLKVLTLNKTRTLLQELGHFPQKKRGQNFLIDGNLVRKSLELAQLQKGDPVVEIGPGLGTLTLALLERGAHVYAIEIESKFVTFLEKQFASTFHTFHVRQGNALSYPRANLPPDKTHFSVIANLPYQIATGWLAAILDGPLPIQMVLLLQKEAASRFTAKQGSQYGAISIFIESAYTCKTKHPVSPQCFYPVPRVESTLLHLVRNEKPYFFPKETKRFIRQIFTQRRKQITTILHQLEKREPSHLVENAKEFLLPEWKTARPEDIPCETWREFALKE